MGEYKGQTYLQEKQSIVLIYITLFSFTKPYIYPQLRKRKIKNWTFRNVLSDVGFEHTKPRLKTERPSDLVIAL